MRYHIYTTVDITNTKQYRLEPGKELARQQEQNFQTFLQVLGIRANILFTEGPTLMKINGSILGFETTDIINVWSFEFETEQDFLYQSNGDPVGYLLEDFDGVPYISGLDESMEQNYSVFVTSGPAKNIIFKQL